MPANPETLTALGQANEPVYNQGQSSSFDTSKSGYGQTTTQQTQGTATVAPGGVATTNTAVGVAPGGHILTTQQTSTSNPWAGAQVPGASGNFAQLLAQMFGQHQSPVSAPQWQPGINPFAGSFQANTLQAHYSPQQILGASFQPQLFAQQFQPQQFQGKYSPQQAPQTQFSGQVNTSNPLAQQTTSSLADWLNNPSSFNTPQVQQSYGYLSQNIDDQYKQQQALLEEDMARRGLADSSIRGGRMSDLNVANKSAHEQLANNLLYQQALTGGQDRASALAAAMGYGDQTVGQQLQAQGLQGQFNNQNFQQALAQAAFSGDQNAMAILQNMNIQGFNNQAGQQGFQNSFNTWQANRGAGQQGFENQLALGNYNNQAGQQGYQNLLAMMGYNQNAGQQGFENQLQSWNANAGQANQGFQNQLASYGAGLQGNQQGFNQQQQLLLNMLGYNQQDYQNQLATWQANQQAQQWYQQLLAYLAAQGAG